MQQEYGPRGLSVLAVTSEPSSPTEAWVESKGVQYPYAYDKGMKLHKHFSVLAGKKPQGIPHAILVDPSGVVVWRGHPGTLTGTAIESSLAGAFKTPMWQWGEDARDVRKSVAKGDLGKALVAAAAVQSMPDLKDQVQALITTRVSTLEALKAEGDFLKAEELAGELSRTLSGLPEADRVGEVARSIADDGEAQRVIKGQKKVAKIRDSDPVGNSKKVAAAIEDLRDLVDEYAGTFVQTEAEALIATLRESLLDR